jgi:integrase
MAKHQIKSRRAIHKLSARSLKRTQPGRYGDGGGLWLHLGGKGSGSWEFRWTDHGKGKWMGLGSIHTVSLAKARDLARACREQVAKGGNPLHARKAAKASETTFKHEADALIARLRPKWRSAEHAQQWENTLNTYCAPLLNMAVARITTADVERVLLPIWQTKHETANRVRGRIEAVLDFAKAHGLREGENPARWRGHLKHLLGDHIRLTRGHHNAMPFEQLPAFMALLREIDTVTARALEFLILTAARSGEVLYAKWSEINLTGRIWTVPKTRIKAGREHRVPLSPRAMAILQEVAALRDDGDFIFPGRPGDPLSYMAFHSLLRRAKITGITPHGFRSGFRDWCGECTPYPREIAEAALAHKVGDETERAYRRGDALDKRRRLMDAWCSYCSGPRADHGATVIPLRG